MKYITITQGMAYIPINDAGAWIAIIAVIGMGILIFWGVYKLIFVRTKWIRERRSKRKNIVRKVMTQEEQVASNNTVKLHKKEDVEVDEEIVTPFSGKLMPISEVPDPIFSEKMVGDGFAIEPSQGVILAPVNGEVIKINKNKDSIIFKSKAEREVILHIGTDTSNLMGEGICFDIKEGYKVHAGQRIGSMDLGCVISKVSSIISPIVFPGLKENERITLKQTGNVEAGMKGVIIIEKNRE